MNDTLPRITNTLGQVLYGVKLNDDTCPRKTDQKPTLEPDQPERKHHVPCHQQPDPEVNKPHK